MSESKEERVTHLSCPFFDDVNVPMCIVSVGFHTYIGGVVDFDMDNSNCILAYPLKYVEISRPVQDGKFSVDMTMEKVYAYAGPQREFPVTYQTVYFLHPDNPEDEFLVKVYWDRHQAIMKRDAGKIEVKEQPRIIMPGINDIVASNQGKVR